MIYVIDSIMGSGKTTWAISSMKEQGKQRDGVSRIIYAAPFLKEDQRIKDACPDIKFIEPDGAFGKQADFKRLIAEGKNIVTTHAMIRNLDLSKQDRENLHRWHYSLYLDETLEVITPIERLNEDDYEHLFDSMIEVEEATDRVNWIADVYPKRYNDIAKLAEAGRLYCSRNCQFFDVLPIETLEAMPEIHIMTFLFEASHLCHYLKINGMEWNRRHIKDGALCIGREDLGAKKTQLQKLIEIYDGKLNAVGDAQDSLSATYWKSPKNAEKRKQVLRNARSFFLTKNKAAANECMWSAFRAERMKKRIVVPSFATSFVPFNSKATNDYKGCKYLAYLVNVYENPLIAGWFDKHGVKLDSELYALSSMLQWIWRSALRDGKPIKLYLPSKRMRRILRKWLYDEMP